MCECNNVCKCEPPKKQIPKVGEVWLTASGTKYRIIEVRGEFAIVEFISTIITERGAVYWHRLDQLVKQFKEPNKKEYYVCLSNSYQPHLLSSKPERVGNYIGWKRVTVTEGEFDS